MRIRSSETRFIRALTGRRAVCEPLESRRLLAAVAWDGGGGDFRWANPLNWSTNQLPTSLDDVTINVAGTPTIVVDSGIHLVRSFTSAEAIEVRGGGLGTVSNSLINASLTMTGGVLGGSGQITVSGVATLSGGEMIGDGRTRVLGATRIDSQQNQFWVRDTYVLELAGGGVIDGVSEDVHTLGVEGLARLEIPATRTVTILKGAGIDGDGTLSITGTLSKTDGSAAGVRPRVEGAGRLDVSGGTLSLYAGGGVMTGVVNIGGAGTLDLADGHGLWWELGAQGSLIGSGRLRITGQSAALRWQNSSVFNGTIEQTWGHLEIGGNPTVGRLIMSPGGFLNGQMSGAGTLTVAGEAYLSAGYMFGTGRTRVLGVATIEASDSGFLSLGEARVLQLQGGGVITGLWSGGDNLGTLGLSGTARLEIPSAQTLTLSDNAWIVNNGPGEGEIAVAGVIQKVDTSSIRIDNVPLRGSGSLQVLGGQLSMSAFGELSGVINVGPGGTLELLGGNYRGLTVTQAGAITGTGRLRLVGQDSTLRWQNSSTFDGVVEQSWGVLDVQGNPTFGELRLFPSGFGDGVLTGNGTLTARTALAQAGRLEGTGTLRVLGNTSFQIADQSITIDGSRRIELTGGGTFAFDTASTGSIEIGFDAQIAVPAGRSLRLLNNVVVGGAGVIDNSGTLIKDGLSTAEINPRVSNTGGLIVRKGRLRLSSDDTTFSSTSFVDVAPGASIEFSSSFSTATNVVNGSAYSGSMVFEGGVRVLEAVSRNLGAVAQGFIQNNAIGDLNLRENSVVWMEDRFNNAEGTGAEVVYVNQLSIRPGATLDLRGLTLFARSIDNQGEIVGGSFVVVPDSGILQTGAFNAGRIAASGQIDAWTFTGRAGRSASLLLNTGAGSTYPVIGDGLDRGRIRLLSPAGLVLADVQTSTSGSGTTVAMSGVTLPVDGVYRIEISASTASPTSVGNYTLGYFDSLVEQTSLTLNQPISGRIASPFSLNRHTFSAPANTQVQLDVLAVDSEDMVFDLTGPAGVAAFSGISGDSTLITLPVSGTYVLTARALGPATASYSLTLRQTSQTTLVSGVPVSGTLIGPGDGRIFRLSLPQPSPLFAQVTILGTGVRTELYAKRGSPPTRSEFDWRYSEPNASSHDLLIPDAAAGDWYFLVYADAMPSQSAFSMRAVAAALRILNVSPARATADRPAEITVNGAGFTPGTVVELVGPTGNSLVSDAVEVESFTRLTARFSSVSLAPASYSLRLRNASNQIDTLPNAVQVRPAGTPRLQTRLIIPSELGRHAAATLYLEYANVGDDSMPAPLLTVMSGDQDDSDKPILTLDENRVVDNYWSGTEGLPPGTSHQVSVLARGSDPGLLHPGERRRVPVFYIGLLEPWNFNDSSIEFQVQSWTSVDASPIDWASQKNSLRPDHLSTEQWDAVFGVLTADLATTGQYIQMLSDNARHLHRLGIDASSVRDLWSFEARQAFGLSTLPTLDAAVDASMPTVGIELAFARSFSNSVVGRNYLGALGRGWYSPWFSRLIVKGGGRTVTLTGEAEARATFSRDSRNGRYFAPPGVSATMVRISDGIYELRSTGGVNTRFRPNGSIDFVVDANGNRVTAEYNAQNRLARLLHSGGSTISLTYNPAGRIITASDSAGRTTTYGYDPSGSYLVSVTSHDQRVTRYAYQTSGSLPQRHALLSVERGGSTQFYTYDVKGRLDTAYRTGNTNFVDFAYDSAGRVDIIDSLGTSRFYFSSSGLIARVTDALGNNVNVTYDRNGRIERVLFPTGQTQSFQWCDCGSPASITDELGNTTRFAYDHPLRRLTSFTDALGRETRYTYDSRGNPLETVYPDGSVEYVSGYSNTGLPSAYNNRRGQRLTLTYTPSGQVDRQTFADGSYVDFDYDARGNLTRAVEGQPNGATQLTTYTYNLATDGDRLKRVTNPDGRWVEYTYDVSGRRSAISTHDGFVTRYEYDVAGRLHRVRDGANAVLAAYSYDASGRLSRVDKGNGTFTTYSYDAAGQLLSLVNHRNATTINSRFDYTYDARGRRTSMATLDGTWTYTYDATGQLTRAVFASLDTAVIPNQDLQYVYDAVGNRIRTILNGVTTEYTTNNLNQYTNVGGQAYTYDADGNLTFDGQRTYVYDQQNRLVRVTGPAGVTEYEYDALGNRTATIHNGQRTEYLLDPTGLVDVTAEFDGSGNLTARNVHGLGLLGRSIAGGALNYFDFDAIGSTAGVTGAAGQMLNRYVYEPFGGSLFRSESIANPFQFVGRLGVQADQSGAHFMRARFFEASLGRFVQMDPIGFLGGMNYYSYSINSPTNFVDPTGLYFTIIVNGINWILRVWPRIGPPVVGFLGGNTRTPGLGGEIGRRIYGGEFDLDGMFPGPHPEDYRDAFRPPQIPFRPPWNRTDIPGLFGGNLGIEVIELDPELPDGQESDGESTGVSRAVDPNDKLGPEGVGPENFVSGQRSLPYRIRFENVGSGSINPVTELPYPQQTWATAPAQRVTIIDPLSADLDWSTFRLLKLGFGDTTIAVPPDSQHFESTTSVEVNGERFDLYLFAGIDLATGVVRIMFQSIDPVTGLSPSVLTGFLPPEDGSGRGMGFISFVVTPRTGLPTGRQIRNVARISFDGQPGINTNQRDPFDPATADPTREAMVTIDSTPPTIVGTPLFSSGAAPHTWSVVFSEDVSTSLRPENLRVVDQVTGLAAAASTYQITWNGASRTAVVRFVGTSNSSVVGALPDGRYRVIIDPDTVRDEVGNGFASRWESPEFRFLLGDVNFDGTTGFADLLLVAQNYGQSGRSYSQGNIDYSTDGVVGFSDLLILAQRYGTSLIRTDAKPSVFGGRSIGRRGLFEAEEAVIV